MSADARAAIAGLSWWHVMEVAPGVVTPGWWDLRDTAARMPWPSMRSLEGLRCLDVGTMDGFWAFEMERRGASDVVAIDLLRPEAHDLQADVRRRSRRPGQPAPRRGVTFRVAAELLSSAVSYRDLSVYELDPRDIGEFDLVFMGYVLQMLRDPLRGLEAIRSVCRGCVIVLETVSAPLSLLPAPVARLDARQDGREWFVFNRRGLCKALELVGLDVDVTTPILRDRYAVPPGETPPLRRARALQLAGVRGRSAAVRAWRYGRG